MSNQAGSLAEVLRLPEEVQDGLKAGQEEVSSHQPPEMSSHQAVSTADTQFINYLATMSYPQDGLNDRDRYASNRRSPSPLNPDINIDPSLANLAYVASTSRSEYPRSVQEDYHTSSTYTSLGEMGGKRRKAPHERAGWNEMEGDAGPRKRGRKKAQPGETGNEASGSGGEGVKRSASPGQEAVTIAHLDPNSAEGKAARLDQNRKAQQAFRRRREERMKELEAAAAALAPMNDSLNDAKAKLRDKTLALDAANIEIAALRAALRSVSRASGVSILSDRGGVAVEDGGGRRAAPDDPTEVEDAFGALGAQSRELAKQMTARRLQDESNGQGRGHS